MYKSVLFTITTVLTVILLAVAIYFQFEEMKLNEVLFFK